MSKKPSNALIRAYGDLVAATGGVAEARDILTRALLNAPGYYDRAATAESVARQADRLAKAARAYAAALREEKP